MGKLYLLLIPLLIWGCEQTYDNVIDTSSENYQVTSVFLKDTVDLKVPGDSLFSPRLVFSSQSKINKVYFDVYAPDNTVLNSSPIQMNEISSQTYEGTLILYRQNPIGNYNVKFFATGFNGVNQQIAASSFYFNNGQDNLPPVISNTDIEPDTVQVTEPTVIFTSVEAFDPNGAIDISEVYFKVYKPDGTTNGNKVLLFDDGNVSEHGDLIAGDSIYSRLIQVDQTNDKGTYRFEFQAKDKSGALSNIINHNVLIQ